MKLIFLGMEKVHHLQKLAENWELMEWGRVIGKVAQGKYPQKRLLHLHISTSKHFIGLRLINKKWEHVSLLDLFPAIIFLFLYINKVITLWKCYKLKKQKRIPKDFIAILYVIVYGKIYLLFIWGTQEIPFFVRLMLRDSVLPWSTGWSVSRVPCSLSFHSALRKHLPLTGTACMWPVDQTLGWFLLPAYSDRVISGHQNFCYQQLDLWVFMT